MSLEHILLAMLHKPGTGYDLKAEFEGGAKFFWSAEYGQIYPTLQAMQKKGWLTSTQEPSEKGPPRKVYRRTKKGNNELHEWLRSGPATGTERFAWIGQLLHLWELDDLDATQSFIERFREKQTFVRDLLRGALTGIEAAHPKGEETMSENEFHDWLALQFAVRAIDARIDWCLQAEGIIGTRKARTKKANQSRKGTL